jgi:hypothetical protein
MAKALRPSHRASGEIDSLSAKTGRPGRVTRAAFVSSKGQLRRRTSGEARSGASPAHAFDNAAWRTG